MIRVVAWLQILFVLGCIGYSTYFMFQGNFQQALLPYPILVLYYLIFLRKRAKGISSPPANGPNG
jgi:hypothetical protein